ncbi:MAG: hypothetical protein QGH37_29120 [Candidatus Poribacteria bacterium]|jgi:hypothetical protein|nr:hypothetical protein [Candidatus Poribacteria bacterium]MDP6996184.1 hypothetical protein [Candidatus Poribacteria bacterium]
MTEDFFSNEADITPITPYVGRNNRPTVRIDGRAQFKMNAAFNRIIEKDKENPLGVYRYVKFGWGHHPTEKVISGFEPHFDYTHRRRRENYRHDEEKGAVLVGRGILYLQFTDTEDIDTIEVSSKYPKNVIGINPVFQSLMDSTPKNKLGLPPLINFQGDYTDEESKELRRTRGYDFNGITSEDNHDVHGYEVVYYTFGPMTPDADAKDFIFAGTNIKLNYKLRQAALRRLPMDS